MHTFASIAALILVLSPIASVHAREQSQVCIQPDEVVEAVLSNEPAFASPVQDLARVLQSAAIQVDLDRPGAVCASIGEPSVSTLLEGNDAAIVGSDTPIRATLTSNSPVGSILEATVSVFGEGATCSLSDQASSGTMGLGSNQFVLLPSALHYSLAWSLSGQGQTVAGRHLVDFGGTLPGAILRLDAVVRAELEIPGSVGRCILRVTTQETFPAPTLPIDTDFILSVLPEVGLPLVMGSVQTIGGWSEVDTATKRVAAPATQVASTTEASATVTLSALVSHVDGFDYDDRGVFWFSVNGMPFGGYTLNDETAADVLILESASLAAGPVDAPRVHHICLHGKYIDGGIYDSNEGEAETCSEVQVITTQDAARTVLAAAQAVKKGAGL